MAQGFLATDRRVSGAANLPPDEWMGSAESFTGKLRVRENCTRVIARRNMTRVLCDKKIKPGEAGPADAFLFSSACARAFAAR